LPSRYLVKTVRVSAGERMPLLIDNRTSLGVFEPTAFSLFMRSKGDKQNTLDRAMRSIQLLFEMLDTEGIDLLARAKVNELLTLGEIETLVERCRFLRTELLKADAAAQPANVTALRPSLKKGRAVARKPAMVVGDTTVQRLYYITAYLDWFSDYVYLLRLPSNREEFRVVSVKVVNAIKSRIPKSSAYKKRKGLTNPQEQRLLAVIATSSSENPWSNPFVRNRNCIVIRLMLAIGVRKGELLGLKIDDIDFRENTVRVIRHPDDPEDQRLRQPQTKTASRILPIAPDLAEALKKYLVVRNSISKARKTPFVFVSGQGNPLALNSIDALFSSLRKAIPELAGTHAHLLRHTWNDRFSELVEGTISEDEEKQLRNYLMGWSDQSRMAENYTARYVEKRARSLLLKLQDSTFGGAI